MEPDLAERLARIIDPGSPHAVAAAAAFLLTVSVVLALLALDVYCLRGVLLPAYREAVPG